MIIYGGDKETVEKQLKCNHKFHGPCIDSISRYYKCTRCFCLDRDVRDYNEYLKLCEEQNYMETVYRRNDNNDVIHHFMQLSKKDQKETLSKILHLNCFETYIREIKK